MILTPEEAKLYYELHWALLAHANRRLGIIPDSATIDDILALSTTEKKMYVREALYEDPDTLESFITENPEGLSADELAIVASWRHRVSGDFYIARYLKRYTVFLSTTEPERLYGVLGLVDSIEDIFAGRPLPIYVQAVLLPFHLPVLQGFLFPALFVFHILLQYARIFCGLFRLHPMVLLHHHKQCLLLHQTSSEARHRQKEVVILVLVKACELIHQTLRQFQVLLQVMLQYPLHQAVQFLLQAKALPLQALLWLHPQVLLLVNHQDDKLLAE